MNLKLLCLSLTLMASPLASAEQKRVFDDYQVHYNAFNSNLISADTARQVQLVRSRYRGLVNISVQDLKSEPIPALVQGYVRNLAGQIQPLEFQRIEEEGARYYIASFSIAGEDDLEFKLEIQAGSRPKQTLAFRQKLVAD